MADHFPTCVVFLLGYPGVGKRTVGTHLAELLDGVLVDNQLINVPLLTLFKWDGKFPLPMEIWERAEPRCGWRCRGLAIEICSRSVLTAMFVAACAGGCQVT